MGLLVIDGNCLMIDGGWLGFECIYTGVLIGFLERKHFLLFNLKETSKKLVLMRFVSIVMNSSSSLSKLVIPFINMLDLGPLARSH